MTVRELAEYLMKNFDPDKRVVIAAHTFGFFDIQLKEVDILAEANATDRQYIGPHDRCDENEKDKENHEVAVMVLKDI